MRQRVSDARVGRLATITAEGHPHLVPCCFALDGDRIYTAVDAKPKSTLALRRLANITANAAVTLLVDHYAEDWAQLWWVRVDGTAMVVTAGTEREAALACLREKYAQYRETAPPGPVIAITIAAWRGWP